jgi:hypothetical protein
MIQDNPELKGVDPNTPEGQEKIQQAMQKRMAPQMRQRMAEMQTENRAKLREAWGMTTDEFSAVEPLLGKVEAMRQQKALIDGMPGMPGRGGGGRGPGRFFNPQMMLGDTPLDPAVQAVQDAGKSLRALLDDKQASNDEVAKAVTRLRAARSEFTTSLNQAQEELRSVLTPRQEAELIDRGTIE